MRLKKTIDKGFYQREKHKAEERIFSDDFLDFLNSGVGDGLDPVKMVNAWERAYQEILSAVENEHNFVDPEQVIYLAAQFLVHSYLSLETIRALEEHLERYQRP